MLAHCGALLRLGIKTSSNERIVARQKDDFNILDGDDEKLKPTSEFEFPENFLFIKFSK